MNHTFLPNDEMQILGENRHSETNLNLQFDHENPCEV